MKTRTWAMAGVAAVAMTAAVGAGRMQERSAERDAVERAVLDYAEAVYEVKPELVDRGVHPELAKRGFVRAREGGWRELKMNFAELRALAERWNAQRRFDPASARKQVEILDLLDQTASAKLVAEWGIDYLHLARYDGGWKIVNVLWQEAPKAGS